MLIRLAWQTKDLKKAKMLLRHSFSFKTEKEAEAHFKSIDNNDIVSAWLEFDNSKLKDLK